MKNLLKLSAAILLLLAASRINAQTVGDVTVNTFATRVHDSNWCHSTCHAWFDIVVDSSFVGDSVKVYDTVYGIVTFSAGNTTGVSPWHMTGVPTAILFNPTITDDQLTGGSMAYFIMHPTKIISGPDTVGPLVGSFSLMVTDPCEYDTISGRTYIDNSLDCIYNTGDEPLSIMEVRSTASLSSPVVSANHRYSYTNHVGYYNMTVQKSWMTSYNVALPSWYYFVYALPSCFSGSYTYTTLPQGNVDFPLLCTGNVDVMNRVCYPPAIRYGTPFKINPRVSNTGCDTVSGTLTLVKDPHVIYSASLSYIPATSVSGDTLRWTYTNLTNLTGAGYWNSLLSNVHLTPDTSAHPGDTLCFRIYSTIPTTDINPLNNDFTICLPVVYSYDPNVKEVQPAGAGTPGYIPASTPELTYTLHFQNTGTSYAMNVNIVDTLDANVDPASLKILGASHRMVPEWVAPGVVKFGFPFIYLLDSTTDEAASHGSVTFSVKLDTALAAGTEIKNKGYIYFDLNPPVITNTVLNTISGPLQAPIVTTGALSIYPNPAQNTVHIGCENNSLVTVTDVSGAILISRYVASGTTTIDISNLANGVYIVKAISNNKVSTCKLVKL
ncbi:MAG: hypothetical protein K0Q79_2859 [Flavipsychrobacter sp.]|jgi:hypothetical protein|nr:hypothetical protein [Flavipsychrobacter sp.]